MVVAENVAKLAGEVFADEQNKPVPCVIVVPFTTEPEGFAVQGLVKALRAATGIDILQSNS